MAYDPTLPFQHRELPSDAGIRLRSARIARGLSRQTLAQAVAIHPKTLARIERGAQKPLWATLERICDELGLSVFGIAKRWAQDSFDLPQEGEGAPGLGLRALRVARGMTLLQLADSSGVSAATLSRFERGLTASRLLAGRVGGPGVRHEDRDVVLDNDAVAAAFGLSDSSALSAACSAAAAGNASIQGGLDP
jgi:transcriptional regulator with XRE-family HTH domain